MTGGPGAPAPHGPRPGWLDLAALPPRATETAVVVLVPEVELVVGTHRASLDRAAGWGVPAHVTVLYPFVPPAALDGTAVTRLRRAVAGVPAFECAFTSVERFGEEVAWLAPEPDGPFRALTAAAHAAFPEHPPYGGAHEEVVPHLTLGESAVGGLDAVREAAARVAPMLPVRRVTVRQAVLMAGRPELLSWRPVASLPLGPA